jgi:hypothetical protein
MNVTSSKGKLIVTDGRKTMLAAGEVVNGRALVRVPRGLADMLRRGYNGHVAMIDGSSGMASAPSASQAKKMLRELGIPADHIKEAFGHLR